MDGSLTRLAVSNVKRLREQRRWTRAELARRAQLSASFIGKLEAHPDRGLTVETLEAFAKALGVTASSLLEEDKSDERGVSGQGTRTGSRSRAVHADPGALVPLGKFVRVSRGPELPPGSTFPCYQDGRGRKAQLLRSQILSQIVDAVAQHSEHWERAVHCQEVRIEQCYLPGQVRPFDPPEETGAMLFLNEDEERMKEEYIFSPELKIVVEPRTRLSMVDRKKVGIPQVLYSLVPNLADGSGQCTPEIFALRVCAFLMTVAAGMVPGIKWDSRSYRPRVRQIEAIPVPVSITMMCPLWERVDSVVRDICETTDWKALSKEREGEDAFDRCIRLRDTFPHREELVEAIKMATDE